MAKIFLIPILPFIKFSTKDIDMAKIFHDFLKLDPLQQKVLVAVMYVNLRPEFRNIKYVSLWIQMFEQGMIEMKSKKDRVWLERLKNTELAEMLFSQIKTNLKVRRRVKEIIQELEENKKLPLDDEDIARDLGKS